MDISYRVRAILITQKDELLVIGRRRPGQEPYWIFPGGGVENDEDLQTALSREIAEEVGGVAEVLKPVYLIERPAPREKPFRFEREVYFLCRIDQWDVAKRSGPEFQDASRGEYRLETIPLVARALEDLNLLPEEVKTLVVKQIEGGNPISDLPSIDLPM